MPAQQFTQIEIPRIGTSRFDRPAGSCIGMAADRQTLSAHSARPRSEASKPLPSHDSDIFAPLRPRQVRRAYHCGPMFKSNSRHPDPAVVLDATRSALHGAVERLRMSGMSRSEAASEMLRSKIYDWAESESDEDGGLPRLRSVKD